MSSKVCVYFCLVLGICATLASGAGVVTTVLLCNGDFTLINGNGHVIHVQSALYGRQDPNLCTSHGSTSDQTCSSVDALNLIYNLCDLNSACILSASNNIFGDPCNETDEYLIMSYFLLPPEEPTTMPPTTDPPTTMPPTTDPPTTMPPTTDPPTTMPLTTDPPTAMPPTTDSLTTMTTMPPTTDPPTTMPPTTDLPKNLPSTTDPPTNIPPTTDPPTTMPTITAGTLYSQTICQGGGAVVKCSTGRINICSAIYGRTDSTTCPHDNSSATANTNCMASGAFDTVSCCNGLSQCALTASNDFFGEPCEGTSKYLTVTYTCGLGLPPTNQMSIDVCEGEANYRSIACPAGQTINICSSIYGRSDTTTCPGTPATSSNVNCQSPNPFLVRILCQGNVECGLIATDYYLGGDPCPSTTKYLHVDYTCVS